jgi:hypothetical protein
MSSASITTTSLLAEASSVLESGGYQRMTPSRELQWPTETTRVFEDAYSVAALLVYETWGELRDTWTNAQGTLTELISANIRQGEPKAWDGYLVVLTPASSATEASLVDQIRYDVTRVRKLVATADDLLELNDVRRILLPLLPLEASLAERVPQSAIDLIPELLAAKGTPEQFGRALVEAFLQQEPLLEALGRVRTSK